MARVLKRCPPGLAISPGLDFVAADCSTGCCPNFRVAPLPPAEPRVDIKQLLLTGQKLWVPGPEGNEQILTITRYTDTAGLVGLEDLPHMCWSCSAVHGGIELGV